MGTFKSMYLSAREQKIELNSGSSIDLLPTLKSKLHSQLFVSSFGEI
jgi:hypothetical protein